MSESEAQVANLNQKEQISSIWLIPIIALLIGGWMVYQHWTTQGPMVTLYFDTAAGIEAGKTRVKALSVDIGKVESVELNRERNGVVVRARLSKSAEPLLNEDSQFWVVRPRIGTEGISGLDTLLSGAYIQLEPGQSEQLTYLFDGLESAPVTPPNTPGLRLTLMNETGGTLYVGDPISYRGFNVGRVESTEFDAETRTGRYQIFINAPFDKLVNSNSRFWSSSGINLDLSAEGVQLQTDSLATLLSGGVSFDDLPERGPGSEIEDGASFKLHPNRKSILQHPYRYGVKFLVLFDQSIRGLKPDAPVEFRGIRIGSVVNTTAIDMRTIDQGEDIRIPVLIKIEPGRMGLGDKRSAKDQVYIDIARGVVAGMRATLKTGNLLTGSTFVDLDFYENVEPAILDVRAGYTTLPTVPGSLEQLQQQVVAVLDKINNLELESVLEESRASVSQSRQLLVQLEKTTQSLDRLLNDESLKKLPQELTRTLVETRTTLRDLSSDGPIYRDFSRTLKDISTTMNNLDPVLKTIEDKPDSLLFGKPPASDPVPEAAQ